MIKAKVVSITGERVLLALEDGQSLTVALSAIEGIPKVGQEVVLVFAALGSEDAGRQKLAQDLLNELLKA